MPRRWSRAGDGMAPTAIQAFFDTRQQQISTTVRLYALVDGLPYADQAGVPQRSQALVALFDQTPARPWPMLGTGYSTMSSPVAQRARALPRWPPARAASRG